MKTHQSAARRPKPEHRYFCILWEEDGEWTAHNPDLGAFGVGASKKSAIADFAEAAKLMISYIRSIGEELPPDRPIEVARAEF